eukprot:SAG22_NODE_581_length_8895_cov_2.587767_8_plen_482_part_00
MPKYDADLEAEIVGWMEEVTGLEVDLSAGDLLDSLRSGVYLCNLLNALKPKTVRKVSTKNIPMFQIENISKFTDAVTEFGVQPHEAFTTGDLWDKGSPPAVLNCLAALKRHTMPDGPGAGSRPPPKPGSKFAAVDTSGGLWGKPGGEHRAAGPGFAKQAPAPAPAPRASRVARPNTARANAARQMSGAAFGRHATGYVGAGGTQDKPLYDQHRQVGFPAAVTAVTATIRIANLERARHQQAAAAAEEEAAIEEEDHAEMEAELAAVEAEIALAKPAPDQQPRVSAVARPNVARMNAARAAGAAAGRGAGGYANASGSQTKGGAPAGSAAGHAYGRGAVKNNYGAGAVRMAREGEEVTEGLDATLRKKMVAKYDPARVAECVEYIEAWTGQPLEGGDLIEACHSGVLLCGLANAISPGVVRKVSTKSMAMFQMENITKFVAACRELGVSESSLFSTASLWERKNPSQVLTTLLALKRVHPAP